MKLIKFFIIVIFTVSITYAQNTLNKLQYWFDNNFQQAQTINVSNENLQYIDSIDVQQLTSGFHTLNFRCRDQQGKWSSVISKTFLKTNFTNNHKIVQIEYWYNTNFQNRVQISANSAQYIFIDSILISSLNDGFHIFNFRVKDNTGKYSSVQSLYFLKTTEENKIINLIEYWIDNGFNSRFSVALNDKNIEYIDLVNVNSLSVGFHTLNIRFRDNKGQWSSVVSKFFFRTPDVQNNEITHLEYWYDHNFANRVELSLNLSNVVFLDSLSVNALSQGMHVFNFRFKDNTGKYSTIVNKYFYKVDPIYGNKISALRYWFDNDINSAYVVNANQTNYVFLDSLNVSQLNSGMHILNLQFKDLYGKWSSVVNKYFYKSDPLYGNVLTNLEYWFDNDFSSANQIPFNGANITFIDSLNVSSLSEGMHILNFRLLDTYGKYSSVINKYFYKLEPLYGNKITEVQYWIDEDFQHSISSQVLQANLVWLDSILVNSLPEGMHVFNYRVKDMTGKWSVIQNKYFYKLNFYDARLTAYQYWFNDDFNSLVTQTISNLSQIIILDSLDLTTLPYGFNVIHFRFRDNYGKWSSVVNKYIYKQEWLDNKIVAYRYWLNDNYNDHVYTEVSNPSIQYILLDSISLTSVPAGNVLVRFQFKDIYGKWSSITTDTADKQPIPVANFSYTVQYFCDSVKVYFNNTSIDGNKFIWQFGDGTQDSVVNPVHIYYNSSTYNVTLTALDTLYGRDSTIVIPIEIHVPTHVYHEFSVSACDIYYWNGYPYTTSGDYTQTFPNNYCDSTVTLHLTITQTPLLELGNDTILCVNYGYTSLLLNAGQAEHYLWFTGDTTQTLLVDTSMAINGIVIAQVTTTNGNCSATDSIKITFDICANISGIADNKSISISPNPFSDRFVIFNANGYKYEIIDGKGMLLDKGIINSDEILINMKRFSDGIYSIRLKNNKTVIIRKLIKN